MIGVVAWLAVGLGAQLATCVPNDGWPLTGFNRGSCPQVYQIHGNVPVERGLNVVILPDGFLADELEAYRCAAGLMIEKLSSMAPFNAYSDSINVFRIDLVADSSGPDFPERCGPRQLDCHAEPPPWPARDCQCRGLAERTGFEPPLRGRPVLPPEHADCMLMDLDVRGCPHTAPECQVLWPEGEGLRKLWRVAACAPAQDIVLVLSNTGAWAGGGTDDLQPPLAVSTLNNVENWDHRSRLLAHELGHALGLLDEYPHSAAFSGESEDKPVFHEGRNLVRAEPGKLPVDVPWAGVCTPQVAGLTRYAAGSCFTVCGCREDCDLPDLGKQPVTGLFEGGFYDDCHYFRPSRSCRMQSLDDPFCQACALYMQALFQDLGIQPNKTILQLGDDPDANCSLMPPAAGEP